MRRSGAYGRATGWAAEGRKHENCGRVAGAAFADAAVGDRRRGRLDWANTGRRASGLWARDEAVEKGAGHGGTGRGNVDDFDGGWTEKIGNSCGGRAEGTGRRD